MKLSGQNPSLQYVIIGNSAAGISAAEEIRKRDPRGRVTVVSDEKTFGYSRVRLPLFIAGKTTKREMVIAPRTFYASQRIRLLRGETAEAVDPRGQVVHLRSGKQLPYDRLLVATGSSSKKLGIPGEDLPGVSPLRKITDAETIKRDLRSTRGPIVIVGGGLVGVKSLEALVMKRREVHLVISSDRILSQMLDKRASDFFLSAFERNGVHVHFHRDVKAFEGTERVKAATLSDGSQLSCELAIIGKGVVPNVDCLREAGVSLNQGVIIDDCMASSLPSIYAAGDVAEPIDVLHRKNRANAIWPTAVEGGRIAGSNMADVPISFSGGLRMNSVEILGVRVISAGEWAGGEEIVSLHSEKGLYRKLVFSEGRLRGFLLVGDVRCAGILTSLIKNRTEVSTHTLEREMNRGFSYRPRLYAMGGSVQTVELGGMKP